jgi:hypothetical protein
MLLNVTINQNHKSLAAVMELFRLLLASSIELHTRIK